MNSFKLLLFTLIVAVLTASSPGIGISYAQQDSPAVTMTAEQKAAVEKRDKEAAIKAREKRDAVIKTRHATKEYIKKVVEGQQPGEVPKEPVNAGTGGNK